MRGELVALLTLMNVFNYFKVQKVDITKVCGAELLTIIYTDNYYSADRGIWTREGQGNAQGHCEWMLR